MAGAFDYEIGIHGARIIGKLRAMLAAAIDERQALLSLIGVSSDAALIEAVAGANARRTRAHQSRARRHAVAESPLRCRLPRAAVRRPKARGENWGEAPPP